MKKLSVKPLLILLPFALVFALVFLCAAALPVSGTAQADDSTQYIYAPVANLKDNAYPGVSSIAMKNTDTGDVVFYLPESYYAQYLKMTAGVYHEVVYEGKNYLIDKGALEPSQVAFANGVSPYPDKRLSLAEGKTVSLDGVSISAADDYTFKLLGFSQDGGDVYVSATKDNASKYGMLDKSNFIDCTLPYHPIAEAQRKTLIESITPPSGGGSIVPDNSTALRILLIVGIAVPAVIIVVLLFKPSKHGARYEKRPIRSYSKRNDYDRDREYKPDGRRSYDYRDSDYDRDSRPRREDERERGRYYGSDERERNRYPDDDRYPRDRRD